MGEREHAVEAAPAAAARAAGGPAAPVQIERMLTLQRQAGNAAVNRTLARRSLDDISVPSALDVDGYRHRSLRHERHAGPLAVRGTGEDATGLDADDIRQGALGDCFFLSPLMSLVRMNPGHVRRMIRGPIGQTSIGANVYDVTFRTGDGSRTIRVDDRFVTYANGRPVYAQYGDASAVGPEIWVMVMEKAWAAFRGGSYQNTHFGMGSDAIKALTGSDSDLHQVDSLTSEQLFSLVQNAIMEGKIICPGTRPASDVTRARETALGITVTPQHLYNFRGCHTGTKTFDIANPHGVNHLPRLSEADFRIFFRRFFVAKRSSR